MKLRWSAAASLDILRLQDFLSAKDPDAARQARASIRETPKRLLLSPRLAPRIEAITDTEVRRILAGRYELQYEIVDDLIVVLRVFHQLEDRLR